MKILYISCHAILEYDEVKLLSEVGYDVFSAGVYAFPQYRAGMPRPGIDTLTHYPDLERMASTIDSSGGAIPQPLIDWADTIIFMHRPEWLEKNWQKLKHKRVIFRSIGQCISHTESLLRPLVVDGLQIIRYSPRERHIFGYAGENGMIRFYKDPEEYQGYVGTNPLVVNFTQSIKQRARFCHYDEIQQIMAGYPNKIYGIGNEDLGEQWGGEMMYEQLHQILRTSRVFVYAGTWPACYTLSFIEALMTGMPIVAVGKKIAQLDNSDTYPFYEIPDIIQNGYNGYCLDDINELHNIVGNLLSNHKLALELSRNARITAIQLFGKETIKTQWQNFLGQ